jgi:hypothetical protein
VTAWELTRHAGEVGMAQLPASASVPRWALADDHPTAYWSVSRTADELCVIGAYDAMPGNAQGVGPFVVFSVDGPLDHSLVGVLAGLLRPLADAGISILAQSTFDTDWILVPTAQADECMRVWAAAGHTVDVEQEEE